MAHSRLSVNDPFVPDALGPLVLVGSRALRLDLLGFISLMAYLDKSVPGTRIPVTFLDGASGTTLATAMAARSQRAWAYSDLHQLGSRRRRAVVMEQDPYTRRSPPDVGLVSSSPCKEYLSAVGFTSHIARI